MKWGVDIDDSIVIVEDRGAGIRACSARVARYETIVVSRDVADVVSYAGGWLCDRVRAGWKVTVLVPEPCDTRPLDVLGMQTRVLETELQPILNPAPRALALAADILALDDRLRDYVSKVVEQGLIEVTVWGDCLAAGLPHRLRPMRHRLSGAARAFKKEALTATARSTEPLCEAEEFHCCAPWYPVDAGDLLPVS